MQVLIYAGSGFLKGAHEQIFAPIRTNYPTELGIMGTAFLCSGHWRHLSGEVLSVQSSDFLSWQPV